MNWVKNNNGITIFDSKFNSYPVDKSHPRYDEIMDFVREDNEAGAIAACLDKIVAEGNKEIINTDNATVRIHDNCVFLKIHHAEFELEGMMANTIKAIARDRLPLDRYYKFINKLANNPLLVALCQRDVVIVNGVNTVKVWVESLLNFLSNNGHPITEDGDFIGYKVVRPDYYDFYSGTVLNKVGEVISHDRAEMDPDSMHECSNGLHVGNLSYAGPKGHFHQYEERRNLAVQVNPSDVVSVPSNETSKMRVCKYKVVAEITEAITGNYVNVNTENSTIEEVKPQVMNPVKQYVKCNPEMFVVGDEVLVTYTDLEERHEAEITRVEIRTENYCLDCDLPEESCDCASDSCGCGCCEYSPDIEKRTTVEIEMEVYYDDDSEIVNVEFVNGEISSNDSLFDEVEEVLVKAKL